MAICIITLLLLISCAAASRIVGYNHLVVGRRQQVLLTCYITEANDSRWHLLNTSYRPVASRVTEGVTLFNGDYKWTKLSFTSDWDTAGSYGCGREEATASNSKHVSVVEMQQMSVRNGKVECVVHSAAPAGPLVFEVMIQKTCPKSRQGNWDCRGGYVLARSSVANRINDEDLYATTTVSIDADPGNYRCAIESAYGWQEEFISYYYIAADPSLPSTTSIPVTLT